MAEDLSFRVKNGLVVNNAFLANSTIVSLGSNITINTTAYFVNSASTNTTITAGQVTVGANVAVNTIGLFVNNASANVSSLINATSIATGNSTVNAVTNSSSIAVSNSTVNTTISTGQVAVGANAIVNTTSLFVNNATANISSLINATSIATGNSTVNAVANSSSVAISNSTVNTNVSIGRIAVGANAIVNTIGIFVNNATANVGSLVNATSIATGNSTVNAIANSSSIAVSNSTVNSTISIGQVAVGANAIVNTIGLFVNNATANVGSLVNATSVFTGNTTVNTVIDSVSIAVSNSTFNTAINPLSIRTGNTTINTVVNSTSIATGNSSINTAITAGQISISGVTVNSTIYQGTANNATNLGGVAASAYVNTSGSFTVAGNINFTAANNFFSQVVNVGANSRVNTTSHFVGNDSVNTNMTAGQISISGVTINSTIYSATANNANNLGGVAAASYAQLSGATFTGPVIVSNTLSVSNNLTVTGNLIVTGTTMYANVTNLDVKDLNITVAKGVATAAAADGAGLTVDTANVTWNYSHGTTSWQSNVGITPASNNNLSLGTPTLVWANLHANNVVGTNLYGTIQTTSQPNIEANNSTNFGGLSLATVQSQITANASAAYTNAIAIASNATNLASGTVPTARLGTGTANSTTFLRGDQTYAVIDVNNVSNANNANNLNGQPASFYTNATNLASGTVPTARLGTGIAGATTFLAGDQSYKTAVTLVATSNGLTGGTITSTGTISILANTGIVANATGTYVNAAYIATIAANSATGSLTNTFTVGTASYFVANGNLGIGNTAPDAKLAVTGTANISGNVVVGGTLSIANLVTSSNVATFGTASYFVANGNLGIGTSSPAVKLQVSAASGYNEIRVTSGVNNLGLALDSGATYLSSFQTVPLVFQTDSAERMRITAGGNIGIGTSSPVEKLQVLGGNIRVGGSGVQGRYFGTNSSDVSVLEFGIAAGTGFGDSIGLYNTTSTGLLTFGTDSSERMRITSAGNVGIGNTAPNAKLQVTGTANISGNVVIGGSLSSGSSATVNGTITMTSSFLRNRIINGDMRIDQRNNGSSVTVSNTASGGYAVDRFRTNVATGTGAVGVITAQRVTTAPAGFNNSLQCTVTTADASVGSLEEYFILQFIEGFNFADLQFGTAGALPVTLSFWVRSSLTGSFGFSLKNNTTPPNRTYPTSYTINSANTWEFKTITIPGDTGGSWDTSTTNGKGAECHWSLGAGSSYKTTGNAWTAGNFDSATGTVNWISTSGATFNLTGVQLEVGSTATPFERRHYGQELALCQRYYYTANSTASYPLTHWLKQSMRATPTISTTPTFAVGEVVQITTEKFRVDPESVTDFTFRADAELS
jgi:hypothetical protein